MHKMKKSQINIFLILGCLTIAIAGIVIYTNSRITEKMADGELENLALSPGQIAPLRTYVENSLYTLSEEAIFNGVGAVENEHLLATDEIKAIIAGYITSNLDTSMQLSEFESMEISKQSINKVNISINPNDVAIIVDYPWAIKSGNVKTTLSDFKTMLFIRLGLVYSISEYLASKIIAEGNPSTPYQLTNADCIYISALGGQDSSGSNYVQVTIASGLITITDRYTEQFYFQKPFIFKFKIANVDNGSC